jgi:EmrB/QacA subfamily drug resistance transporter
MANHDAAAQEYAGKPDRAVGRPGDALDGPLMKTALVFILGSFMSILDSTIVNVALKDLTQSFDAPLATIQWVSTGYILSLAAVIPLTGWSAERFGRKRTYIAAIVAFVIGSALAAVAWSAGSLLFFRVLQGIGGGVIVPAGMIILTKAAGPSRIGRVMGIVGVPMLLAPIVGPIIGGSLVVQSSWRWIFLVNLPVGLAAIVAAAAILPPDERRSRARLDWVGVLLLSSGLAAFVYGFAALGIGAIAPVEAFAATLFGLALVVGFIVHARRHEDALITKGDPPALPGRQ